MFCKKIIDSLHPCVLDPIKYCIIMDHLKLQSKTKCFGYFVIKKRAGTDKATRVTLKEKNSNYRTHMNTHEDPRNWQGFQIIAIPNNFILKIIKNGISQASRQAQQEFILLQQPKIHFRWELNLESVGAQRYRTGLANSAATPFTCPKDNSMCSVGCGWYWFVMREQYC